ncbi:MAG: DUF2127 domain-containing protein [Minisyncoccota bacterium]
MLHLKKQTEEKDIFYLFEGTVILKGIHATIEIVGGILTLIITQNFIIQTVLKITHEEILEDSKDFLANYLINASQNFSINSKHFVAFYLLSHGIIKGVLVIALLKNKLWAYPTSIFVFGAFIVYQIIRYTETHSIWLTVFTVFDVFVIWLIWCEFKIQKTKVNSKMEE